MALPSRYFIKFLLNISWNLTLMIYILLGQVLQNYKSKYKSKLVLHYTKLHYEQHQKVDSKCRYTLKTVNTRIFILFSCSKIRDFILKKTTVSLFLDYVISIFSVVFPRPSHSVQSMFVFIQKFLLQISKMFKLCFLYFVLYLLKVFCRKI